MSKIKDADGMSMVEVTFASVVLLGAIMIMVSMFDSAVSVLSFTTTRSIATQIGNEQLENARGMDYEQVLNTQPATWPVDASLDKSTDPPMYLDNSDTGTPVLRTIATTTSAGYIPVEQNVIRKHTSYTIRTYILWVGDGAVGQAYKRIVAKIAWPSPGVPGEIVMVTNIAKSDTKAPRPSVTIAGVVSRNFNYFNGQSQDATMGQDDGIRGPSAATGNKTPQVFVKASINSAKATGISRVDFTLFSPSAAVIITGSDNIADANGYFSWDLPTTAGSTPDNMGYLIKAEAFDSLGRSEVATMRINIDNTLPAALTEDMSVIDVLGSAKRMRLTWIWSPGADPVPDISRFIISRKIKPPFGVWGPLVLVAAMPATDRVFRDNNLIPGYTYGYNLKIVDTAGNIRLSNDVEKQKLNVGAASDTVAPTPVTTETAASASWKAIDLVWEPATDDVGVFGYTWKGSDNGVDWTIIGQSTDTASNPIYYQDTGLKPGKTYSYRPDTFDFEGNVSGAGPLVWATTPMR